MLLMSSLPLAAAELSGHARVWAAPGYDSNAARDFVSTGAATWPDAFLGALVSLDGLAAFERATVAGTYDGAGRKFVTQPSEDTVIQSAQVDLDVPLTRAISVGATGRARDRRGAERDYTDLTAAAALTFSPDASLEASLDVGAERFIFRPRFAYSYSSPTAAVRVKYRFNRQHSLWVTGSWAPRKYNALTNDNPNVDEQSPQTRRDTVVTAGLGYSFKGPFQLQVSYSFFEQASNSYGESLRRHRLQLNAGVRLPWSLMLLGSVALQYTQFPDSIFLSPELQVIEDEENSSFLTLKLVRPVAAHVDLDARYALYVNVLPQVAFLYVRHVATVGVTLHW